MATINEVAANIEMDALKGLPLQARVTGRNIVEVEGYEGKDELKALLVARGYELSSFGDLARKKLPRVEEDLLTPRERYESLSPEEQYEWDAGWIRFGGYLADYEREQAIRSGKSYEEYLNSREGGA